MRSATMALVAMLGCDAGGPAAPDGGQVDAALDAPVDAPAACAPTPAELPAPMRNPWALAIAPDGTTYAATNDVEHRIDRWTPRESGFDNRWAVLGAADFQLLALAIDSRGQVFVGTADGLWRVAPGPPPAQATRLVPGLTRTVTIGPGDEPYYTALAGAGERVYRWTANGPVEVSSTGFGEPSDLLFEPDGTLLLSDQLTGLHRLTLDGQQRQTSVEPILAPAGGERIFALARDREGHHLLGFNGLHGVQRYDPAWTAATTVSAEHPILDLGFARGALGCDRVYATHADGLLVLPATGPGAP